MSSSATQTYFIDVQTFESDAISRECRVDYKLRSTVDGVWSQVLGEFNMLIKKPYPRNCPAVDYEIRKVHSKQAGYTDMLVPETPPEGYITEEELQNAQPIEPASAEPTP